MSNILQRIVESKRREIEVAKSRAPEDELRRRAADQPPTRPFVGAIEQAAGIALIAEIKRASPSKGVIREDFDPPSLARIYQEHGAHCLSVLTDRPFFQGELSYLTQVRETVHLPLLRKDFLLEPYQLYEARVAGADAVLLIAECLTPSRLAELQCLAESMGMDTLVELYEERHLEAVLACGTRLVGVNNRDLRTFEVDLGHSIRLKQRVPADRLMVSESGIHTRDDVVRLADEGIDAILVGESLMRSDDVGQAVRGLDGDRRRGR